MKYLIAIAAVFVVAYASSLEEQWQEFKIIHGRTYKSLLEEKRRFAIFKDNVRKIEEHNVKYENGEISYYHGINQFTDMTDEEFAALLSPADTKPKGKDVYNKTLVGDVNINWVSQGLVTPVKNQLNCGSCWAFSAVGAIEAQVKKHGGALTSLSAQNLVDCDTSAHGCGGGMAYVALIYAKEYGVLTDAEYPYVAEDQDCMKQGGQKISSYVEVGHSEDALLSALSDVGPIAVGIEARELKAYAGGIFDTSSGCTDYVNHGVLAVGAATENGKDYWLIKNSWGAEWGEAGYFKLIRGKKACGILKECYYPKI